MIVKPGSGLEFLTFLQNTIYQGLKDTLNPNDPNPVFTLHSAFYQAVT